MCEGGGMRRPEGTRGDGGTGGGRPAAGCHWVKRQQAAAVQGGCTRFAGLPRACMWRPVGTRRVGIDAGCGRCEGGREASGRNRRTARSDRPLPVGGDGDEGAFELRGGGAGGEDGAAKFDAADAFSLEAFEEALPLIAVGSGADRGEVGVDGFVVGHGVVLDDDAGGGVRGVLQAEVDDGPGGDDGEGGGAAAEDGVAVVDVRGERGGEVHGIDPAGDDPDRHSGGEGDVLVEVALEVRGSHQILSRAVLMTVRVSSRSPMVWARERKPVS